MDDGKHQWLVSSIWCMKGDTVRVSIYFCEHVPLAAGAN